MVCWQILVIEIEDLIAGVQDQGCSFYEREKVLDQRNRPWAEIGRQGSWRAGAYVEGRIDHGPRNSGPGGRKIGCPNAKERRNNSVGPIAFDDG
jgi:hypothetical protein